MRVIKAWFFAAIGGGIVHTLALLGHWMIANGVGIGNLFSESFGAFVFSMPVILFLLIPSVIAGSILLQFIPKHFWLGLIVSTGLGGTSGFLVASGDGKFFGHPNAVFILSGASAFSGGLLWYWAARQNRI
ncbi:MAG: hypothetical protein P1V20_20410 [Verrucomicrobiales bacterium]|nr:hypothetical protein [Verrucomicrobiales bacterium]